MSLVHLGGSPPDWVDEPEPPWQCECGEVFDADDPPTGEIIGANGSHTKHCPTCWPVARECALEMADVTRIIDRTGPKAA